jgi:hypothetical protein
MLYGAMNSPIRPLLNEVEVIGGLGFDYLRISREKLSGMFAGIRSGK